MARGGTSTASAFFTGRQTIATVDDLDAFVRRAAAEQSFTYCEAPELIRSETSARVTDLAGQGLVRPHRRRRQGGGWVFFVVRTRKPLAAKPDPVQKALSDPATDLIFRALKRAANLGQPCHSDAELARIAGLNTRDQAQWRFRSLIEAGLIASTLAYEGGVPSRVVTIAEGPHAGSAGGKFTALPKKWAALQAAAERELKSAGGAR
jgi:hypothetical protein